MSKKKTKSKKTNPKKQADKKKSTESSDNQNANVPTIEELRSFMKVMKLAQNYFKDDANEKDLHNLAVSLRVNNVPDILTSKFASVRHEVTSLINWGRVFGFTAKKNIIRTFVKDCCCYPANILAFEGDKLAYKMSYDYFNISNMMLESVKELMRNAYLRKYYFMKRGIQIPDYLKKLTTNVDYVEFLSPMRQLSIQADEVNFKNYKLTVLEQWNIIRNYYDAFTKLSKKCELVELES